MNPLPKLQTISELFRAISLTWAGWFADGRKPIYQLKSKLKSNDKTQ